MKKTTTELGKVIAEAREKVGISQRELSRRANMDCAEVSRIESGKRIKPNKKGAGTIMSQTNL